MEKQNTDVRNASENQSKTNKNNRKNNIWKCKLNYNAYILRKAFNNECAVMTSLTPRMKEAENHNSLGSDILWREQVIKVSVNILYFAKQ